MNRRISFFGGETRGSVRIANGHETAVDIVRELGFDQDLDGRWLVWVHDHDGRPANGADHGQTGAVVVNNRDVSAFLELLGKLIVDPVEYLHDPVFSSADDPGQPSQPPSDC